MNTLKASLETEKTGKKFSDMFYEIDENIDVGFCKNPVRLQGMERERFIQEFSDYHVVCEYTEENPVLKEGYKDFKRNLEKLLYLYKHNPHTIDYFESILKYLLFIHNNLVADKEIYAPVKELKKDFGGALKEVRLFEKLQKEYFEDNEFISIFKKVCINKDTPLKKRMGVGGKKLETSQAEINTLLFAKGKEVDHYIQRITHEEIPINVVGVVIQHLINFVENEEKQGNKDIDIDSLFKKINFILQHISRNETQEDDITRVSSLVRNRTISLMKWFIHNSRVVIERGGGSLSKEQQVVFVMQFLNNYVVVNELGKKPKLSHEKEDYQQTKANVLKQATTVVGGTFAISLVLNEIGKSVWDLCIAYQANNKQSQQVQGVDNDSVEAQELNDKIIGYNKIIHVFLQDKEVIKKAILRRRAPETWENLVINLINTHINTTLGLALLSGWNGDTISFTTVLQLLELYKEEYRSFLSGKDVTTAAVLTLLERLLVKFGLDYTFLEETAVPKYVLEAIKNNKSQIDRIRQESKEKGSTEDHIWDDLEKDRSYGLQYFNGDSETLLSSLLQDVKDTSKEQLDSPIPKRGLVFKILTKKDTLTEDEYSVLKESFFILLKDIDEKESEVISMGEDSGDLSWIDELSHILTTLLEHYINTVEHSSNAESYKEELFHFSLANKNGGTFLSFNIDFLYERRNEISNYITTTVKEYFLSFLSNGKVKSEKYYYILTHIFLTEQDYEKAILYSTYLTKEQLTEIQPHIDTLKNKHTKEFKEAIKIVAEVLFKDEQREGTISTKEIIQEAKSLVGYPTNTLSNNLIIYAARDVFKTIEYTTSTRPTTLVQEKSGDALPERLQKGNVYEKLGLLLSNIIAQDKNVLYQYGEYVKVGIPDMRMHNRLVDLKLGNSESNIADTIEKYQLIIQSILKTTPELKDRFPKLKKLLIMTLSNNGDLRDYLLSNYGDQVKFHGFEKVVHLVDYTIQKQQLSDIEQTVSSRLKKFLERKNELEKEQFATTNPNKRKADRNQILGQISEEEKNEVSKKNKAKTEIYTARTRFITQLKEFQDILLHQKNTISDLKKLEYLVWDVAKDYILNQNTALQEALHQKRDFSWTTLFQKRDLIIKYCKNEINYDQIKKHPLFRTLKEEIETSGKYLIKENDKYVYKPIPKDDKFSNPFIKRDRSKEIEKVEMENRVKREKRGFEQKEIDSDFQERTGPKKIAESLEMSLLLLEEEYEKTGNAKVIFHKDEITEVFAKVYPNVQDYIGQAEGKSYENKSPETILKMLLTSNLCGGKRFQQYGNGYFSLHHEQRKAQYLKRGAKPERIERIDAKILLIEHFKQHNKHLLKKHTED